MVNNKFGLLMKYPSKETKRDWYLSSNPNNDSRITRKHMISNGKVCGNATDGFYWCGDNGQIRIHVAPYVGKDDSKCACDQGKILQRGYMETSADWRNYEISGEMRLRGKGDSLTLYGRGEYHHSKSSSGDCDSCKGSSVKVNIELSSAKTRFAFETWHVNYNHTPYTKIPSKVMDGYSGGSLYDKWFRFIHCVYNINNNSKVVCELYLSRGLTNEFHLVNKITVPGGVTWTSGYDGAKDCGCPKDDTPILWGGPIASYRWDDMSDGSAVKWRKLSIREIDVTKTFGQTPGTGGSGSGSTPPPASSSTLSTKFKDLFNIGIRSVGDSCAGVAAGNAPYITVYNCETGTSERGLHHDIVDDFRIIAAQKVKSINSPLYSSKPRQVIIPLKKVGTPGGNASVGIWDDADPPNQIVEIGTIDASSLTTSFVDTTITNEIAPTELPEGMKTNWCIGISYEGTSATDYIKVQYDDGDVEDGQNSGWVSYQGQDAEGNADQKWQEFMDRDLRMRVNI